MVSGDSQQIKTVMQTFARGNYRVASTDNTEDALGKLSEAEFHVVIASTSLSPVNCEDFLTSVSSQYPTAMRIIIEDVEIPASLGIAHFSFQMPINGQELKESIEAFADSQKAVTKKEIVTAVAGIKTLPSPPKVYMQLNAVLKNENTDSLKIAEIITQDPALAAKVLQFANSAVMAKGRHVQSIPEAITKMGIDTLCCIVMTAELFAYEPDIPNFSLIEEQLHSLSTAKLAASIVKPELKQETLIAGLLHDLGKLILFEINPALTKRFIKERSTTSDNIALERQIFSTDHSQIGGYLLHMWAFPYPVIEAVILHHSPEKLLKKSFGVAQAVYLANKLLRNQKISDKFIAHYKLDNVLEKLEARAEKLKH